MESVPVVALGLEVLVEDSPETVLAGSSTPEEFNPASISERPDVFLVDALEADPNRTLVLLQESWPEAAVLALTPVEMPGFDFRSWLRAGATGGVSKASPLPQLLQAIRAVARGDTYNHTRIVKNTQDHRRRAPLGSLTGREKNVLTCIAQGMTSREAAERMELSNRTIETHVRTIFLKMNVNTRAHAVSRAIEEGIIDAPSLRNGAKSY